MKNFEVLTGMIELKGGRGGVVRCVVPAEISEEEIRADFKKLLRTGSRLLSGGEIEMDLQSRKFSPELAFKICAEFVAPCGGTVSLWLASDEASRAGLSRFGFKTSADCRLEAAEVKKTRRPEGKISAGFAFFGNVRGGRNISHAGDVIIVGNVNTGGEVAALGNITVLGRIAGLVHAGCNGDVGAVVSTRSLETGQVRIGTKVGIIDRSSSFWGASVTVRVSEEEVLVAPWPAL